MKRIYIALALFLGVLGGVNAQEFNFECADEIITYDHPDYDGVSSYNLTRNILIVEGILFPTNGDFSATWSHQAPSNWAIGNQVIRFDINEGNYTVGFHSNGGVPLGETASDDFALEIRNLLTHKRVIVPIISNTDGTSTYDPNTGVLNIDGANWNKVNGENKWNAPAGYLAGSQWTSLEISRVPGNFPYTIWNHKRTVQDGTILGQVNVRFDDVTGIVSSFRALPIVTSTDGNSSFNPNTNQLIVDGVNFDKTDNAAISNSPREWAMSSIGISVFNPFSSNNPRSNWSTGLVGASIDDITQFDSDDFDGMIEHLLTLIWKPLSHEGAVYNSRENTFSINGTEFVKNGNRYDAPNGSINANRWARLSFIPLSNGRYRWDFQNNGLGTCDGYDCGGTGGGEYPDFVRAVEPLSERLGNKTFFADRNGPSINHKRLNQWTGTSGWTREPINGRSYPGNIRLTITDRGLWNIILEPNGKPGVKIRSNFARSQVRGFLPQIAGDFDYHYGRPRD